MPAITDTAIRAALKRAADSKVAQVLKDPAQVGLELRVAPSGTRTWRFQYRTASGPRRHTLGAHSDQLGLAQARIAARSLREEVRKGSDPVAEAQRKRTAQRAGDTLASLIELYERQRGGALKSWPECRRRIESVFARHLERAFADLTLQALQHTADHWPSGQSAAAAVRYLRPVMKWASHPGRGYVARDLILITPPATVRKRQRVLTREELSRLLPVLRCSPSAYAAALQFMLLTACRREEAGAALWRDVDLDNRQWRLPETKNGKEHLVPLSRQAVVLLRDRLPAEPDPLALIFTSDGSRLANWHRATKSFMVSSETEGWHRHDLRRTAATMMGQIGNPAGHRRTSTESHQSRRQLSGNYNLARYLPEVAEALQRLADVLDRITAARVRSCP